MKKGIVLKLAMFVAAFAISTFAPSMTAAAASYGDEFVALINQKRAANGLQAVSLNSTLDNAAETRAEELTMITSALPLRSSVRMAAANSQFSMTTISQMISLVSATVQVRQHRRKLLIT